ncbi:MAG: hypothetical protein H6710_23700 [Myxococcales bacterium]|nr:hypothetical protein [Myxococcales bacterium]
MRPPPEPKPEPEPEPAEADTPPTAAQVRARKPRRFLVGLEGVAILTPALRPRILGIDRRFLGETTTLGGVGVFGRWRAVDWLALDLAVRSGSIRFQGDEGGASIAEDVLLAEAGALLFLARGDIGHLAIDGGLGGLAHQISYTAADGTSGRQRVGAALFRVGLDIELLLTRLAFVISLRAHGVVTDRARTRVSGALFEGAPEALRQAPLPVFQTYVIGSAGVAYRF